MNRVPKPESEKIPAALTPDGGKWCDASDGATMAPIGTTTEAFMTTVAKASANRRQSLARILTKLPKETVYEPKRSQSIKSAPAQACRHCHLQSRRFDHYRLASRLLVERTDASLLHP